jgi:maltooligosyltrehalose trehalohydrolase
MSPDGNDSNRFGPVPEQRGTRFQLWAPAARSVALLIDDHPPMQLTRDGDGFWQISCSAAPGTRYRFDVDGLRVPDPASRFQPEDTAGPSQLIDTGVYVWKHPEWVGLKWEQAVIYEAHLGVMGGYKGMRTQLAELAALGITALELMPIADFAGARNWGYDGVLPFAPDSAYGKPDELRALIDEAHGHGIMVFLDVVYNHFGPEGNYLPAYVPQFFDPATTTPWGAAINFHAPPVRRFFIENALYWLEEFRFDGLRLDAVHAIPDRSWLTELAANIRARLAHRHIHLMLENEKNDTGLLQAGFDAQWNDDFHNVMHVLLTGESHAYYADFADQPAEKLARCLREGFVYQGEPSPHQAGNKRGGPSAHLPPTAFIGFLQNHDQIGNRALGERLTHLAAPRALRAAMALLLLCPHIPLLFMGEEHGAQEPFLFFADFTGDLATAVREGRRKEFAHAPGFGQDVAADAIPDPNAWTSFAASRWTGDAAEAGGWHTLVRDLLAVRHQMIVPFLAGARSTGAAACGEACVRASWRLGDGAALTIVCNLGSTALPMELPSGDPLFGARPTDFHMPGFTTLAWITP